MTPLDRFAGLVAQQPDNELFRFSYGKALLDAERPADALVHLEVALEKKQDWMAVAILAAKCHLTLGNPSAAKKLLEKSRDLAVAQNHESPLDEVTQLLTTLS